MEERGRKRQHGGYKATFQTIRSADRTVVMKEGREDSAGIEEERTLVCDVGPGRRPGLLRRQLLGQAVALHEGVLLVGHACCDGGGG